MTTHKMGEQKVVSRDRTLSSPHLQRTGPCGIDMGGTLTKMVYWRPPNPPQLPSFILRDSHLSEVFKLRPNPLLTLSSDDCKVLKFLKFPTSYAESFMEFLKVSNLHQAYGFEYTRVVNATGGGAFKYADIVHERLGLRLSQLDEMTCLIRGLNFLLKNTNEVFTYRSVGGVRPVQEFIRFNDGEQPFPYLLVNVGSGVSIVCVRSDSDFERVSGSALGGGTFWGLCRLLSELKSFDEVATCLGPGDNKNVDLMVGDIYGQHSEKIGLRSNVIASCFGKLQRITDMTTVQSVDIVKSLLYMVADNIGQIAFLNAQLHGCNHIFFGGGFVQDIPCVWEKFSYAIDFWSKGEMKAMFLLHNGYLGALGALLHSDSSSVT